MLIAAWVVEAPESTSMSATSIQVPRLMPAEEIAKVVVVAGSAKHAIHQRRRWRLHLRRRVRDDRVRRR